MARLSRQGPGKGDQLKPRPATCPAHWRSAAVMRCQGRRATGLDAGRAQLSMKLRIPSRAWMVSRVRSRPGIGAPRPGVDDPGGEGNVAGDHQVAWLDLLGDDMICHIEALLHLLVLMKGKGGLEPWLATSVVTTWARWAAR